MLRALKPGDKVKITQTVRVGAKKWTAEATEARSAASRTSETGITTDRREGKTILVVPSSSDSPKPNGELTSISIDEHTPSSLRL